MCDGKPHLCSTCHNRFDCDRFECMYWSNHLRDIPYLKLRHITLSLSDDELIEDALLSEHEEEGNEAEALHEAEMYEMD